MRGKDFYEAVADALTGFLPPSLRDFGWYKTSHNIKLWYGDEQREHYEVQVIRQGRKLALEIGFHAEHKDKARNEEVLNKLVGAEKRWRRDLGKQAEVGPFIGYQSGSWRRLSEVWDVTDDPEIAIDAADRLATYIRTLEPVRNGTVARRPAGKKR
jgi:hypothetical protein